MDYRRRGRRFAYFLFFVLAILGILLFTTWDANGQCVDRHVVNVTDAYDGDTFTADVELGFGIVLKERGFRLKWIDTPELHGPRHDEAVIAKKYLRNRVMNRRAVVCTFGKGKYGRWLAEIYEYFPDADSVSAVSLNEKMLTKGLADPYGD